MIRRGLALGVVCFILGGQPIYLRGNITLSEVQDETNSLISAGRAFVDLLVRKDFKAAVTQFDETMKGAMPEPKLEETWNTVLVQAGAFKQVGKARTEKRGAYTIVSVTCDFEKTPLDIKVVFDQAKRIAGLFFAPATNADYAPPAYVKADSFREKEVTVGTGEWALPATLTTPADAGPFPAVVLVHGSGPHDRDETIGPNKPFKDLAWGLASNGIAVLRYEKRTKQYPSKLASIRTLTVKEEVLDDVLAAAELLRKTEGIDPKRIFVLGHSLGGMLVPRIARIDPNLAGLISLAGATRPLEDVIPEQLTYIFSLDGSISPEDQKRIDDAKEQSAKVKALKIEDANSTVVAFGVPASYWLDLRGYDPPETAKALKQPLLILQGERDYQVTMEDFKRWNAALASRSNVTFKLYPELNHLFVSGSGRSSPSEYETAGHVDTRVVSDITGWIQKH
ncbi:MAG TPA: alpha/beta fold hydrolase [Pyrinomonadaceae bacterium]|nr:alpha/beta fold hydrolase [Pyrinomonadaceae bacterium]